MKTSTGENVPTSIEGLVCDFIDESDLPEEVILRLSDKLADRFRKRKPHNKAILAKEFAEALIEILDKLGYEVSVIS